MAKGNVDAGAAGSMYAGLWVPRVVLPVSAGITVAAAVGSGDRMAQRRDWRQRAWYVAGVFVPSTASSGGYQSSARRTVAEVDPRMTVLGSDVGKETRRRDRARPHRHRKARLEHSALPCCQAAGKWLYVHRVQANVDMRPLPRAVLPDLPRAGRLFGISSELALLVVLDVEF